MKKFDAMHGDDVGVEIPKGTKINLAKVRQRKDELIRDGVHPHPTVSELIPTMLESLTTLK